MIRDETEADREAIRRVHESAFPTNGEARLVDLLRRAGKLVVSLVAVADDQVVGHVAFSPVRVAGHDEHSGVGLAPVSVDSRFRKRGIAESLIKAGLKRATELGYAWVVVLGDPAYYGRFGFVRASTWALEDCYGGGDAFQALELCENGIPAGGAVAYADEFDQLS